jgi:MtN3 and saliva related transmembrane protein
MKLVDLLGYAAGIIVVSSLIPQTLKSWKTKLTRDLSLARYVMYTIGLSIWILYGVLIQNGPIAVMNSIAVVLSGSILYLKIRYK